MSSTKRDEPYQKVTMSFIKYKRYPHTNKMKSNNKT